MMFTGANLGAVEFGLRCAESEVNNQIVTCPDPQHYAPELENYVAQLSLIRKLLKQIDAARVRAKKK